MILSIKFYYSDGLSYHTMPIDYDLFTGNIRRYPGSGIKFKSVEDTLEFLGYRNAIEENNYYLVYDY